MAAALGDLMERRVDASLFDGEVCVGGWVARLVVECQMGVDVFVLVFADRRRFAEREGWKVARGEARRKKGGVVDCRRLGAWVGRWRVWMDERVEREVPGRV